MSGSYYSRVIADFTVLEVRPNCCMDLIPRETSYYVWVVAEMTHRSSIKDIRSEVFWSYWLYFCDNPNIVLRISRWSNQTVVWIWSLERRRRNDTPVLDKRLVLTLDICRDGMVFTVERCRDGMVFTLERCRDGMVLTLEICGDGMVSTLERC